MRVVIQRVTEASLTINNKQYSHIYKGMFILVGIENSDTEEDIKWLQSKILKLRIFNDNNDIMNLSINEIYGEIMVVSQFTLFASTKKGNRPSYIKESKPDIAIPLYKKFCQKIDDELFTTLQTGIFGADMQISLINDGPVTICMDSHNKE